MKIEKIEKEKYKIIIDGEVIITYEDVIIENKLLYKKELTKNEYNEIIKKTTYYDIYNKVVKLILKTRKSEKQVREYLIKNNISNNDIESIIKKLKNINLINDLYYTKAYINDKLLLNKWGINKIRMELINQDIDNNIIENCLNNIDEDILNENMKKIIIKKINSNHKYSNYQLKNKILQDMINLGYNKEKIISIIDTNLNDDLELLKKEYSRLYKRLQRKYNENELKQKVKQSLINKGFKLDKVNSVMLINEI